MKNFILSFIIIVCVWQLFLAPAYTPSLSISHAQTAYAANEASGGRILIDGLNKTTNREPWIFALWNFCLSLINVILIGLLIYIGVVNILHLNYDTYEFKKILLPLIIAVILANFSMFICRSIVELSSALTNTFFSDTTQITGGIYSGLRLNNNDVADWMMSLNFATDTYGLQTSIVQITDLSVQAMATIIGVVVSIIVTIAALLLTLVLYVRVYIIFILAAVSPLAFAFMVVPATQNLFRQWWTWFLRWVFMGPIIALVLRVAAIIGNSVSGTDAVNNVLGAIAVFIIIIVLMVVSFMVPFMLGGNVYNKIKEAAQKTGSLGWGALGQTKGGRTLRGVVSQPFALRKAELEQTEKAAGEGTREAINTIKSGAGIRSAMQSYNEATEWSNKAAIAEQFKRSLENEEGFSRLNQKDDKGNSRLSAMAKANPQQYQAIMERAARSGYLNEDDFQDILEHQKNSKTLEQTIDVSQLINLNNEARIKTNKSPLSIDEINGLDTKSKSNVAAVFLENYEKYITSESARHSGRQRDSYRGMALDNVSKIMAESEKTLKDAKATQAQKQSAQRRQRVAQKVLDSLNYDVEHKPEAQNLQSNPKFQSLRPQIAMHTAQIQDISNYIADNTTGGLAEHQRASLQETLSKSLKVEHGPHAVISLLNARDAITGAGFDVKKPEAFINQYNQSKGDKPEINPDFVRANFSQMERLNNYSQKTIDHILGKSVENAPAASSKKLFTRRNTPTTTPPPPNSSPTF